MINEQRYTMYEMKTQADRLAGNFTFSRTQWISRGKHTENILVYDQNVLTRFLAVHCFHSFRFYASIF